MLTDKAMRDFEKWAEENGLLYMGLPMVFINTAIIDWLDSVGFLIELGIDQTSAPKFDYKVIKYEYFGNYETLFSDGLYRTRNEATKSAIQKANELYNTTHP